MHDERMGIAAKGLSGEGYKVIFVLGYRNLYPSVLHLHQSGVATNFMYRYLGLDSVRKL